MKIWDSCEECDDYWCNIHEEHVYSCDCPTIETWAEEGRDPYEDEVTDDAIGWVNENPRDFGDDDA